MHNKQCKLYSRPRFRPPSPQRYINGDLWCRRARSIGPAPPPPPEREASTNDRSQRPRSASATPSNKPGHLQRRDASATRPQRSQDTKKLVVTSEGMRPFSLAQPSTSKSAGYNNSDQKASGSAPVAAKRVPHPIVTKPPSAPEPIVVGTSWAEVVGSEEVIDREIKELLAKYISSAIQYGNTYPRSHFKDIESPEIAKNKLREIYRIHKNQFQRNPRSNRVSGMPTILCNSNNDIVGMVATCDPCRGVEVVEDVLDFVLVEDSVP